jgi:DNA-binding beta-propeller fold protein YncE
LTSLSSSEDLEGSTGGFRRFVLGEEKNLKPIVKPYGVSVWNKKIYLCDTVSNAIEILDVEARRFEYFAPKDEVQIVDPIHVSFDINGDLYVADAGRGQVVIFDQAGNLLGTIGKRSEFKPSDVLVAEEKIYLCDLKTSSVKVFGLRDRDYLFSLPREGSPEEARLFSPTNIAADSQGNLYVSDTGACRIQKYSPQGEFLMSLGSQGDAPGQFARPKGVALDREGRVYAVDAAFENVQIFDPEGKLLLFFAEPGGSPVPLVLPAGIAVDYSLKDHFSTLADPRFEVEYLVLVTSQYGDRKLSVFGFGRKR